MTCKGCYQSKKLVKSHIIPESFFRQLKSGVKPLRILSNIIGIFPKKSPIGIYDPKILCQECENIFKIYDDYGFKVLVQNEGDQEKLIQDGKLIGYRINNIDTDKLKLFFLSVLWRASISTQPFYSKINVGDLEDTLKEMIWGGCAGGKHDFSFVLAKFDDQGVGKSILDPHGEEWSGVSYYRFYMHGYVLYIKCDIQETSPEWSRFIPSDNSLILISRGNMENSKEYGVLKNVVQSKT